ncbi:MAG: efflux RND transporter periplasmic adaptor subunit [Tropicimonas sp.]|uniref:efflux RND transporter periplasmic adaptor subunit n=1 Tax=Tropicimonas sp. TaxID=2067044 RepID=UPI003A8BB9E1
MTGKASGTATGLSRPVASTGTGSLGTVAVVAMLIVAIAAGLWLWRAGRGADHGWQPPGAIDVVATRLVAGPAPQFLEAPGEIRAVRQVVLASEVAGRVAAISFEPGQRVTAGTLLVRLEDATEQADLNAARVSATFARRQFERAAQLILTGAATRETLQQRESERDRMEAQVRQLEARIAQKRIRAPFDGVLGLRQVDLGQYLNAGDPAVSLTDPDRLHVDFDVPQQDLLRLRVGQRVEVRSDAPGAPVLPAHISAIEPQVGRKTRNATLQAVLEDTGGGALHPGMYVTATVLLPSEPDALLLPVTAIMTSASGDAVAVIRDLSAEGIGAADIVPVKTGRRLDDRVIVTAGLTEGDMVITTGQVRLQPGLQVRMVEAKGAQPPDDGGAGNGAPGM